MQSIETKSKNDPETPDSKEFTDLVIVFQSKSR